MTIGAPPKLARITVEGAKKLGNMDLVSQLYPIERLELGVSKLGLKFNYAYVRDERGRVQALGLYEWEPYSQPKFHERGYLCDLRRWIGRFARKLNVQNMHINPTDIEYLAMEEDIIAEQEVGWRTLCRDILDELDELEKDGKLQ